MATDSNTGAVAVPASIPDRTRGEMLVVWVLWLTYGAFYFCRTNISVAVSSLKAPLEKGGLGLAAVEVGWILGSLKVAYGVGQLFNGQLAEFISPRKLLAVGMLCSAALNVLFGLSAGFYVLLFVWGLNGYVQSLGWTPCVRVVANWIPPHRRGRAIGVIGTGYQVTQVLTYLVAGAAANWLGWRGAFYVPAVLLVLTALFMLFMLEEAPSDDGGSTTEREQPRQPIVQRRNVWVENLLLTLTNGRLWLLGVSLGLLNACRYGFIDWGVAHLKDVQQADIGEAALKYALLPTGAVAGAYLSGWATDRFFGGRRAPVICLLLLVLGTASLFYSHVVSTSPRGTLVLLLLIGFCIFGPQVLLVGTAPADLARKGTSAAAAGFVNFLGYMGGATGDVLTGKFLDSHGWVVTTYIWAGWAFAAAITAALLWNTTASRDESSKPST